jgi:hypothetical protein
MLAEHVAAPWSTSRIEWLPEQRNEWRIIVFSNQLDQTVEVPFWLVGLIWPDTEN